jgi:hypothetical protein
MPKKTHFTEDEVIDKFDKSSKDKKIEILFDAIDYMKSYNGRDTYLCICLAM